SGGGGLFVLPWPAGGAKCRSSVETVFGDHLKLRARARTVPEPVLHVLRAEELRRTQPRGSAQPMPGPVLRGASGATPTNSTLAAASRAPGRESGPCACPPEPRAGSRPAA